MYSTSELHAKLVQGEVEVKFTKVGGDTRIMRCTLKPEYLPEVHEQKGGQLLTEHEPTTMTVWDLDNGAWRSFRIESVISAEEISNFQSGPTTLLNEQA